MLDSREDQVKQERRGIRAKFQLRPYVPLPSTQHRFCTKGPEIGDNIKESWKIILFTRQPPPPSPNPVMLNSQKGEICPEHKIVVNINEIVSMKITILGGFTVNIFAQTFLPCD